MIKFEGGLQESKGLRKLSYAKHKVAIGFYSYGGCFDPSFNNGGTVIIGRYCSFANNIKYFGANHPMKAVSMSPFFYIPSFGKNVKDVTREPLFVGHDVWIGHGVIIMRKFHYIGNGAFIVAGPVVTKDVPAYSVCSWSSCHNYKI